MARLEHLNFTVSDPPENCRSGSTRIFGWKIRWEGPGMTTGYYDPHREATTAMWHFSALTSDQADTPDSYQHASGGLNHWAVVVDDIEATEARVKAEGFTPDQTCRL